MATGCSKCSKDDADKFVIGSSSDKLFEIHYVICAVFVRNVNTFLTGGNVLNVIKSLLNLNKMQ